MRKEEGLVPYKRVVAGVWFWLGGPSECDVRGEKCHGPQWIDTRPERGARLLFMCFIPKRPRGLAVLVFAQWPSWATPLPRRPGPLGGPCPSCPRCLRVTRPGGARACLGTSRRKWPSRAGCIGRIADQVQDTIMHTSQTRKNRCHVHTGPRYWPWQGTTQGHNQSAGCGQCDVSSVLVQP